MKGSGEWGKFFPPTISPFKYHETVAQEHFPQDGPNTEKAAVFPTQSAEICHICQAPYRIVPEEAALANKIGVPLALECPKCRHANRSARRNPFSLWRRQCMCTQTDHEHDGRCTVEFETTYSPERKEIVYCENCYQQSKV